MMSCSFWAVCGYKHSIVLLSLDLVQNPQ
uniref:Uncharacterized protein n=1 Tax=Rhizophora mucronata TaxID=61149 RepID=A0A2P2NNX1_RHIMU